MTLIHKKNYTNFFLTKNKKLEKKPIIYTSNIIGSFLFYIYIFLISYYIYKFFIKYCV